MPSSTTEAEDDTLVNNDHDDREAHAEIFRRYFESRFLPLEDLGQPMVTHRPADGEGEDDTEGSTGSEWAGVSDADGEEEEEEEEEAQVEVVEYNKDWHNNNGKKDSNIMEKRARRAFMVSCI